MSDGPTAAPGPAPRYAAPFLFVPTWMVCGRLLRLDPDLDLLLGVPLTLPFQRFGGGRVR